MLTNEGARNIIVTHPGQQNITDQNFNNAIEICF